MKSFSHWLTLVALFGLCTAELGCQRAEPPAAAPSIITVDLPAPPPAALEEWPHLLGSLRDSAVAGVSVAQRWGEAGPSVVWSHEVGLGYGTPVVAAGLVVLHDRVADEERLTARQLSDGATVWQQAWPTTYQCEYPYSRGPYATPSLASGVVYSMSAQGTLRAHRLATGEFLWERKLLEEYEAPQGAFGFGPSPLILGDRVIVSLGGKSRGAGVVSLDRTSGDVQWTALHEDRGYSSPVAVETTAGPRVLSLLERGLACLSANEGTVDWFYEFGIIETPERVNCVTPIVHEGKTWISSGPGPGTVCLRVEGPDNDREVWMRRRAIDSQYTNLVLQRGRLYGCTPLRSSDLRCIDAANGQPLWSLPLDIGRANSVAFEDALLLLGEYGQLLLVRDTGNEPHVVWQSTEAILAAPCYTQPIFVDGRLLVRNEQHLKCLMLPLNEVPGQVSTLGEPN